MTTEDDVSKRRAPIIQWRSVTSKKNGGPNSTATKTNKLTQISYVQKITKLFDIKAQDAYRSWYSNLP
jgi:hypothetical protein